MTTTETKAVWEDLIPEYVEVYTPALFEDFAEFADEVESCILSNNLDPFRDYVAEEVDAILEYYQDDMNPALSQRGIADDEKVYEEIRDALYAKIEPISEREMIEQVGELSMFYDLCEEIGKPWEMDNAEFNRTVRRVCDLLNIPMTDKKRVKLIEETVSASGECGHLRLYFNATLDSVISTGRDFKTIQFKGLVTVAIVGTLNGEGWYEEMPLECSFQFKRENLHYAFGLESYDYRDIFECEPCGKQPIFLLDKRDEAKEVGDSDVAVKAKQEAETNETFRKGGCTKGDMKMSRHRDVVYIKDGFPCGWRCPHCGTFWID